MCIRDRPEAPIKAIDKDTTVPKTPDKIRMLCTKRTSVNSVDWLAAKVDANAA